MNDDILILGSGGFLGRALVPRLLDDNYNLHRLVRRPEPALAEHDMPYFCDLGDQPRLGEILDRCGTVLHLASSTTPGSSAQRPSMEVELNLLPTLRFLDVLQEFPGRRLIFVSSGGTVYGNPTARTVPETHPLKALSHHGAGKIALETFLATSCHLSGTHLTILRPSNFYGPGQSLKNGFGIIRTMLEHLRRDTTMEIWGDGETVRDFLYIDDMVNACRLVLKNTSSNGEIFNVGAGLGCSINQLVRVVEQVTGRVLRTAPRPQRGIDVRRIVLDCERIHKMMGWKPEFVLPEGIARTWEWVRQQPT